MVNVKRLLVAVSEHDQHLITQAAIGYSIVPIQTHMHPWNLFQEPNTTTILFLDPSFHTVLYDYLCTFSLSTHSLNSVILLVGPEDDLHPPSKVSRETSFVLLEKPLTITDIQAQLAFMEAQHALAAIAYASQLQHQLFSLLFAQSTLGLLITNATTFGKLDDQEYLICNPAAVRLLGLPQEVLRTMDWALLLHPEDSTDVRAGLSLLHAGKRYLKDIRYKAPEGSYIFFHLMATKLEDWYICALRPSEVESTRILEQLSAMAFRCNVNEGWTPIAVSKGCQNITGYSVEQFLKLSFDDLILPAYRNSVQTYMNRAIQEKKTTTLAYEIRTASGQPSNVLEISQAIYNPDGTPRAIEGILLTANDRTTIEHHRAFDTSTGLYTREYLENLLLYDTQILPNQKRALVHINLSAIQLHILTYGFQHSQDILRRVAAILKQYCREDCTLCRTYEHHYTFYLKGYPDEQALHTFCKTLSKTLKTMLRSEGVEYGIGLLELGRGVPLDVQQAFRDVMVASEQAICPQLHPSGYCTFSKELAEANKKKEIIITELSQIVAGIRAERLYVLFQPIVTLINDRITEFEVLARLSSDTLGLISPTDFIPLAEKTKYIIPLGYHIIRRAFLFLKTLESQGYEEVQISINISVIQLLDADFIPNLLVLIKEYAVQPSRICLEITESSIMANLQDINTLFAELQQYGISIALDDFGTGYSSLAHERSLNVDILKIDKTFIDGLQPIGEEQSITGDIISIGHKLGHMVVAEGVEHKYQSEYLVRHGCDKIQGFLINTPLDETTAIEFLNAYPVQTNR